MLIHQLDRLLILILHLVVVHHPNDLRVHLLSQPILHQAQVQEGYHTVIHLQGILPHNHHQDSEYEIQ